MKEKKKNIRNNLLKKLKNKLLKEIEGIGDIVNDDLKGLVEKIKNNEVKGVRYTHLYPFLNDRDIDELVDLLVKDGNAKDLYSALPFMSDKRLEQLHKEVKAGKVEGFKESALLPFLGKDAIKAMVEDLIKNSVDAMMGKGILSIGITVELNKIKIQIKDSGKGIAKSKFKKIFKPGYTTKKRGWGLGLSLSKRIIEDYHKGKITIAQSELGKGTIFRVMLPKTN